MSPMQTLLLRLPLTPPGPQAGYGLTWVDAADGSRTPPTETPLSLLPSIDRRTPVVAVVPAAALSWQRVTLPPGLGRHSARLQTALQGLLEERLLQDPAQVHMALAPRWKAGEPVWVAVCDKAWLLQHLQALETARIPVQRLVPELAPPSEGSTWHALGNEDSGGLWCCSAEQGVNGWPLTAVPHLPPAWTEGATLNTEPGLARWAEQRLPAQVRLVDTASHWISALESGWELAQFDLATRLRQRHWVRWQQQLGRWWRQPEWRPARWGLLALLLVQLGGLNAWAWMTRQQWQAQQQSWTRLLQETFPQVTVVLDAPLQMAREVDRLRQGSGQRTPVDLESQLQALGQALPAGVNSPSQLIYQNGALQWSALNLSASQGSTFEQALQQQGYALQTQAGQSQLRIQQQTQAPAQRQSPAPGARP